MDGLEDWAADFGDDYGDEGPPESEGLLEKARDLLAARAAALARKRFKRSATALLVVLRAQRRFKADFLRPGGRFEQIAAERFAAAARAQPPGREAAPPAPDDGCPAAPPSPPTPPEDPAAGT